MSNADVRRQRWSSAGVLAGGAALLLAVTAAAVGALVLTHSASAKPLGRGAPLVIAHLRPGALNARASMAAMDRTRAEAHEKPLTSSTCLTHAAEATAAGFGHGGTPHGLAGSCPGLSGIQWGWVAGSDPTGAQMLAAAYGRSPSGPSPLISTSARQVGLAVGQRATVAGVVTGYVLVWAVAR